MQPIALFLSSDDLEKNKVTYSNILYQASEITKNAWSWAGYVYYA